MWCSLMNTNELLLTVYRFKDMAWYVEGVVVWPGRCCITGSAAGWGG
jgi:hypothetical protein